MNELQDIQAWFSAQANGEWEHSYGIRIDTCDNPGWWVHIDLTDTPLAEKSFMPISKGVSEDMMNTDPDWIRCDVRDEVFDGAGDASKLEAILRIFLDWANSK